MSLVHEIATPDVTMGVRQAARVLAAAAAMALAVPLPARAQSAPAGSRPAAPANQAAAAGQEETWSWVVRPGDTLIGIGRAYLREPQQWPALARLNRIQDPARLRVGTVLRVPMHMLRTYVGIAEVVWLRGTVSAITGSGSAQPLATGARVEAGSRIETGADSAVRLRLVDGALLLVGERTSLSVDELTVFALPGVTRTKLGVGQGRIEAQVNPQEPGSRYEIRTPVVTTAVRGTDFRVGTLDDGRRARTEVTAGVVDATAGPSTVAVSSGEGLIATASAPMGAAQPLLPHPDLSALPAPIQRLPIVLAWPAVPGARGYQVQLYAATDERPLVSERRVDTATARWLDLPDGSYAFRVRAVDEAGLEGRDAERAIEIAARPQPPFLNEPVRDARLHGSRPALRWTRADGVASYDVEVASDERFETVLVRLTSLAETHANPALPPGRYFWRVASRLPSGARGPFGDAQGFMLRKVPEARSGSASVADKVLTLRWSAGEPGETSQFQLAADAAFSTVLVDRTVSTSEIELPRPAPATYYLRVRALDSEGVAGPFGPTQTIDVPKPPRRKWWLWLLAPAVAGAVVAIQ